MLFVAGREELKPGSDLVLSAFGRLLADPADPRTPGLVVGLMPAADVVRTSAASPNPRDLGRLRAERVRDRLAAALALAPAKIEVRDAPRCRRHAARSTSRRWSH